MVAFLKRIAALLPMRWQQELKRVFFAWQIRHGFFLSNEREYALLAKLIGPGDWVLDIGANVGHYAMVLSKLVEHSGRVLAFEPVPATFELLAANMALAPVKNATLINAAVSASAGLVDMEIPRFDSGLDNFYMAHSVAGASGCHVYRLAIDSLEFPHTIRLAKIDTEGDELLVLQGMVELLRRDHPLLIVEDNGPKTIAFLAALGYSTFKVPGSSNRMFCHGLSISEMIRALVEDEAPQLASAHVSVSRGRPA